MMNLWDVTTQDNFRTGDDMSKGAKKQRERIGAGEDVIDFDAFEPDYRHACDACGETPTVTAVKDGEVIYRPGLCGPCCWGMAECLDPSTW
ncbi:hypothetical protein SB861_26415 [Paraburkholderia sp. SIMBA_049]|jgi:hypothetical protein